MQLGHVLRSTDYLRRSPARAGGPGGHKEWLHFCVQEPGLDLLVNFSIADEVGPRSGARERGHVIILARDGDRWLGDVDRFWEADMDVGGGEVSARLGDSRLRLEGDVFRLDAALREAPIEVHLTFAPEAFPSFSSNIRMSADGSLSWLVVPRLRATGTVRLGGETRYLRGAMAYHDHNWGTFAWGSDFAWEWGYGVPSHAETPWSFMFVRLSDRALTSTRTQALTVWRGAEIARSFRGRELRVSTSSGFLRATQPIFKVPPVMALLAPGSATEVPEKLTWVAEADGDVLEIDMAAESVAQIVVPSDRGPSVTIVNEVAATLHARGRVLGEEIDYRGRGMFEVLTS